MDSLIFISRNQMKLNLKKELTKEKRSTSAKVADVVSKKAETSKFQPTYRQAQILAAIVREYSSLAEPVGSAEITEKYKLKVSPATIRNEMAALERAGLIEQPHTSAGRVPTDRGYRYFVNELMHHVAISAKEQQELRGQLLKLQDQNKLLGQEISKSLARLIADKTDQAAFTLLPEENSAAGLTNIFMHPNAEKKELLGVVEFFENIDEYSDKMLAKFLKDSPETLIGQEHNLPQISNYSMVVSKVKLPSGKEGIIGIVGPKSMKYEKNISLLEYIAKLLSGGLLLILITHIK
jgi:transcriptional regulator of heat shock response